MLNVKYFFSILLYFGSSLSFEYSYLQGFFYLIEDYLLIILSSLTEFSALTTMSKDEVKTVFLFFIFLSFIF